MIDWLRAHATGLRQALRRFAHRPLGALLEVAVLGIALALPLGLYAAVENVRAFAARFPADPEISVFMALTASRADIELLEARLRTLPDLERVTFVPRSEALASLRQSAGLAEVLDALPTNPLPDAFTVRLKLADADRLEQARTQIGQWPQVELVQVDSGWARKLSAVITVGRAAVALLGALLGLGVLVMTFNSIRLQMLAQREEIELSRLIGATDPFIRRPFIYYGALQGVIGGGIALGIVAGGIDLLNRSLAGLSEAYGTRVQLQPLSGTEGVLVLALAVILNCTAAWLSARRLLAGFR